jgi:probable F420-dependent oxidoreductase
MTGARAEGHDDRAGNFLQNSPRTGGASPARLLRLGFVFPQTEIGPDPGAVRAVAEAAEALGFDHLLAFDHVLGAVPRGPHWTGYTHEHPFHEPFVLFAYLAGLTRRVEFCTGILVLPQRQTALVAKQAAEVDVLSGGRLRLGVAVGWNPVEYEALGADFHTRGARIAEQIAVLRALWTQEVVTVEGRWHRILQAGLRPLPVQRPIPIWLGGHDDRVLRRAAALADGWIAVGMGTPPTSGAVPPPRPELPVLVERLRVYLREAGRAGEAFGLEGRVRYADGPEAWRAFAERWRALGGTHLSVSTLGAGLASVDGHLRAMETIVRTLR